MGAALLGIRDKVVLASKTKAGAAHTHAQMMQALEGSLRRLRTDYIDVYFNHAVNDVKRLQNEEWREFTEIAKRQGKIRFRGMSGHGSHLIECLDYAIEHDLVDVVLVAYNFGQDPDFYDKLRHTFHFVAMQPGLPQVLERAKQKDIGVIAMKTLMGARLNDMRPYEGPGVTFAQAAFRWVLASPRVDALLISMTSKDEIAEYVGASGQAEVSQDDLRLLGIYAARHAASFCQHGCNVCEGSCPQDVPIAEVLRTRMYAVDYRNMLLARTDYAQLGGGAHACLACAHQRCLTACPKGIPIARFTRDAAVAIPDAWQTVPSIAVSISQKAPYGPATVKTGSRGKKRVPSPMASTSTSRPATRDSISSLPAKTPYGYSPGNRLTNASATTRVRSLPEARSTSIVLRK